MQPNSNLLSNFWYNVVKYLIYILESVVFILFFFNIYLYFNFFPLFNDFYYFSLFFIHVPISWITLLNYFGLLCLSILFLLTQWVFFMNYFIIFIFLGWLVTFLTITTGMFWGLPLWGLLFVWDARFISVIFLFCLYCLYFFLYNYASVGKISYNTLSISVILGSVNIPLIKYSVDWWNTLHQTSSLTQVYSTIHFSISYPLYLFFFMIFFSYLLLFFYFVRYFYIKSKIEFYKYL